MISNFFSQFDAYTVPPTLRARNKSGVSSLITGALSLLLTLFFTYVFAIKMYQVFTYQSISSVKT